VRPLIAASFRAANNEANACSVNQTRLFSRVLLSASVLLKTFDSGTGKAKCQSLDITRGILTTIARVSVLNASSGRYAAAIRKQRKQIVAHHRSEGDLHFSVTNLNVEVCFDRLFHVYKLSLTDLRKKAQ